MGVPRARIGMLSMGLVLSYPIVTYATQIWPEITGALAIAAILVLSARHRSANWSAVLIAVTATAIKMRLALVTLPAAVVPWLRAGGGRRVVGLLVMVGAGILGLVVGWLTMGHPFGFYRRLAHLIPDDFVTPATVVGGLLFDPAGGLAFAAPLVLVALGATVVLWRHGGDGERAVLIGGLLTVIALLHSLEWYGGGSPPARYLMPLVPLFALTWGVVLKTPSRWRRLGEVLLGPSIIVWWAFVTRPHLTVNPGDGGWWLTDVLARRFQADTQQFFPSFLVPTTATVWFPPFVVGLAVVGVWLVSRKPWIGRFALRTGLALWLAAGAALGIAVASRCDRVVEVEAPQVRRRGGQVVPAAGTFSRFTYRNGWQLANGESVIIPLKLPADATLWLEGWLLGTAQRGAEFVIRWDDGSSVKVPVQGRARNARLKLPDPPGAGRHRLRILMRSPKHGAAVLDRVIVEGGLPPHPPARQ